jgi:hypothetical protein
VFSRGANEIGRKLAGLVDSRRARRDRFPREALGGLFE